MICLCKWLFCHKNNKIHIEEHNDIECIICYERIDNINIKMLLCGHVYHKSCINNWLKENTSCPICRKDVSRCYREAWVD